VIRLVFWFFVIVALAVVCVTVPFGNKTLYGHFTAIWHTKEAQDAKNGIEQRAAPVVDKVEKKLDDAVKTGSGSASGTATAHPSKW